MLGADRLSVGFNQQPVFRDVSLHVAPGEILHVQGQNGSGKSTLLKALVGLVELDAGTVQWQGRLIGDNPIEFRQALAFLGHKQGLKSCLTARENIGQISSDIMGIKDIYHKKIEELSAGQKQRVALTQVINRGAALWVLDEPLTSLDKNSISQFISALRQHVRAGGMAVISSHQALIVDQVSVQTMVLGREGMA